MDILKQVTKYGLIAVGAMIAFMNIASASSVVEADKLYAQQDFEQARIAYLAAAKVGSPHAYYQLGTIYYEGQGTKEDVLSALVWFSLASEYQFNDSERITAELLQTIVKEKKAYVSQLIAAFKKKHGKKQITQQYLPEIITANLDKKITFDGDEELNKWHESIDDMSDFEDEDSYGFNYDNASGGSILAQNRRRNIFKPFYFAIIDYDVAIDGSVRNMVPTKSIGRITKALYDISINKFPTPTFEGKPVNFINRSYSGIATYDSFKMKDKYNGLYWRSKRRARELAESQDVHDRYQYAMTLLNYDWLPQEEGQAITLLQTLAEEGHPEAQYEYGLHLYRTQTDPAQAIKWLSLAGQFGFPEAEYRLARILQESPWVVKDEKKSLFWYESAAKKSHAAAILKVAELKLLANDESLHDQQSAIEYLQSVDIADQVNPEYNYLVAVSHLKGDNRDFNKLVKHLRLAISQGNRLHWDVSPWESQLEQWTTGNVYIKD